MGQHYKEIAAIALKRREAAIPKEYLLPETTLQDLPLNLTTVPRSSGHFTPEELEITEAPPEDILDNIKTKKWTSLAVTKAFCKAAIVAQQLVCPSQSFLMPTSSQHTDKLSHRDPLSGSYCSCQFSR
jgi:amidase